jgi:hypothetical protein
MRELHRPAEYSTVADTMIEAVRRHRNIERVVWHQDQWKGKVLQFGENELGCMEPHRWEEAEILDD